MLPDPKIVDSDNATVSFSDASSNKSPPTTFMLKEELYQELDELLTAFRSDAQQQFCLDQGIIKKDDLGTLQQTVQHLQHSLKVNNHPHHHQQLLPSLTRIIQNILQLYGYACQRRNMRLLDEYLTNQYITDWHRLKQQWDLKAKENQYLHLILDDIILLAQLWQQHPYGDNNDTNSNNKPIVMMASLSTLPKRLSSATKRSSMVNKRNSVPNSPTPPPLCSSLPSSTSEDILTSILTTFDYPPGAYVVTIDKHNYKQLGLQHSKIGTRQIIFDGQQLFTKDIISIMHHLTDAFASLFAATAQTHLATIDLQIKKAQPFYTANSMKQLLAQIMEGESATASSFGHGTNCMDHSNDHCYDSQYHLQQQQPTSTISSNNRTARTSSSPSTSYSSLAVLTPFRLSSPAPSNQPWHHPIPIPSFAPAPWQLPDLLKPRYPYNPLLFGMLRRKTGTANNSNNQQQQQIPTSTSSSSFLKHTLYSNQKQMSPQPPIKGHGSCSATNIKKSISTNAPNKSAPHHYHASSSATINNCIDNNSHAPPLRPSPRASSITSSSVLLQKQQQHCSSGGGGGRSKRYLHPMELQDREDRRKGSMGDENEDGGDDWRRDDKQRNAVTTPSETAAPFTSVSVDKLSFYLGKIAGQFYQDLLTHTRVRYQEAKETLEVLECQMLELYRHLQLASSRAVMHRALMIVQELDNQQQQQQQQQQQYYYYPHQHTDCQQQQQQPGQCSDFGFDTSNSSNLQQQPYSNPSSHDDSDTADSDSYSNNQQTTTKPMVNRWTPICIDNYQDRVPTISNKSAPVAINEKEQINTLSPHFYHAIPPNTANVTMSETTLQAELPKEIDHHVKSESFNTQQLENTTSTVP